MTRLTTKQYLQIDRTPKRSGMSPALLALGRLKSGAMNKTEAEYERELDRRKIAGEVAWYRFEGLKLRLADNTFLTVDFPVMLADGFLEMHEVKGSRGVFTEDAKVKTKVAAEMYPFRFLVCFPRPKRHGGGWDVEIV